MKESANLRYDITGPEAFTSSEFVALVSQAYGKPIRVVQLSDEQLLAGLSAAGLPPVMAQLTVEFDQNTRAGRLARVTDAVEQLTGRKPLTLKEWLLVHNPHLG